MLTLIQSNFYIYSLTTLLDMTVWYEWKTHMHKLMPTIKMKGKQTSCYQNLIAHCAAWYSTYTLSLSIIIISYN